MNFWATIIFLLALSPSLLADQIVFESESDDVRITVQVDRQTAQIVEPIRLALTVTAPRGTMVELPTLDEMLATFQIRSVSTEADVPVSPESNRRRWQMTMELETLETGVQTIPPLRVQYRKPTATNDNRTSDLTDPSGDTGSLSTEPIEIGIVSLVEDRADLTDFRDLKPVSAFDLPEEGKGSWLGWTAAVAGFVVVGLAVAVWIFRRRPRMTPADAAFEQITQLESQVDQLDQATIYDELALIVNRFLALEFDEPGLLLANKRDSGSDNQNGSAGVREQFSQFKSMTDDVRFARVKKSEGQVQEVIRQARAVIEARGETTALSNSEAA